MTLNSIQQKSSVLIVVDVQNGFLPRGNLAVKDADLILPCVNALIEQFDQVVLTQDWHPQNHISFAQNHPNKQPFETVALDYGNQVLWTSHCVQGTFDAEFHAQLNTHKAQLIIRKGMHQHIDSYSAFTEADRTTTTGLAGYLKARRIEQVFVVGVATDFCVAWTAIDAQQAGFKTYVIEDATAGINLDGSLEQKWQEMQALGIQRIQSSQVIQK